MRPWASSLTPNSSGDTIASMMVTRLVEGKDWLVKASARKQAR